MKRNEFLKTSIILGGASLLPVNSIFANGLNDNGMDKLVDVNGNFIHLALPFCSAPCTGCLGTCLLLKV